MIGYGASSGLSRGWGELWNVNDYNDKCDGRELIKRLDMGGGTKKTGSPDVAPLRIELVPPE